MNTCDITVEKLSFGIRILKSINCCFEFLSHCNDPKEEAMREHVRKGEDTVGNHIFLFPGFETNCIACLLRVYKFSVAKCSQFVIV